MRALVTEATAALNRALALGWKLGSGQDSKQTAQARGCPARDTVAGGRACGSTSPSVRRRLRLSSWPQK